MLKFRLKTPLRPAALPHFPDFTRLKPSYQPLINQITKGNSLYSDYNFISLWSWDHQNKLRISTLNGNLVIRFQDYLNPRRHFYSFFGTTKADATAKTLLTHAAIKGGHELRLIPQFVIEALEHKADFVINEDRDSFDYIIAVSNTVNIDGKHNATKRRYINHFERTHGARSQVRELDLRAPNVSKSIIRLARLWGEQTGSTKNYDVNELRAITKAVTHHRHIDAGNLHVLGIYIDDELKAFSISEILGGGFAMGHYKKADRNVAGLGVVLDQYTSKTLREKGVTHINHEQDLGLEGLRQAKLASHPVYFLKKYRVALADGAQA